MIVHSPLATLPTHQRGVSLIDAMIAVVIFSVGLLAVAALQTISKQSNYEAIQRSYASMMAHDLFERMRMNSGVVGTVSSLSYYANTTTVSLAYSSPLQQPAKDCSASATTNCTYGEQAAWDLHNWQQALLGANELQGGNNVGGLFTPTACIDGPGSSGIYRLTIVWRGQTNLPNNSANTCGEGTGLYDAAAPDDFRYRRILEMTTYLD